MFILGLSFDIDAAASLLHDGIPVAACAEERFTRVKHDRSFPDQASRFCLDWAHTSLEELDWAVLGWNPAIHLQPLLWRQSSRIRHHAEYLSAVPNLLIQQYRARPRSTVVEQALHFGDGRKPLRLAYVDHHLAHSAWAFVSGFEEAAILTVDGFGEMTTTMASRMRGHQIEELGRVEKPHSLGSLYAAITQYLGFKPNRDEGTVMSLAAMDEPRFADEFRRMVRFDEESGAFELDLTYFSFFQDSTDRVSPKFLATFGPTRGAKDEITAHHKQIAASLQLVFEETYLKLLRRLQQRTGLRDLVVAGGVALNCVANGRILGETDFERVFIPAASGDDGVSTGAALYLYHAHLGQPRSGHVFTQAYLGPDCVPSEVRTLLTLAGRPHRVLDPELTTRVAARLLTRNRILGWFQGRSEFGPRALGNRTILASPSSKALKDQLNNTIKFRLPFRPFAPSMLAERVADLFEGGHLSPFMLFAFRVRPEWASRVQGILHTDDTARVQTVTPEENPRYYQLIRDFDRLTGIPVVLNTSLNVRGEPIANTPKDALACFDTSAMDYLFLGDSVIGKESEEHKKDLDWAIGEETGNPAAGR